MVRWSELAVAKASLAKLASSFLFMGVENGDFSDMAAAMVACKSRKKDTKESKWTKSLCCTASIFIFIVFACVIFYCKCELVIHSERRQCDGLKRKVGEASHVTMETNMVYKFKNAAVCEQDLQTDFIHGFLFHVSQH